MRKIFIMYVPCQIGETVYYIRDIKLKGKDKDKGYQRFVVPTTVKAIHQGRELKGKGNTYIVLGDNGGFNKRITFDDFENDCFRSITEAHKEIKRREDYDKQTQNT